MEWTLEKIKLQLKYTWKISRNASDFKENFIVTCKDKGKIGRGEVAPNIRYNETPERIEVSFNSIVDQLNNSKYSYDEFENFLEDFKLPNALRFGIESAFTHLHCEKNGITLFDLLQIPKPVKVASCYTLPIMAPEAIPEFYSTYDLNRFHFLKVKVSDEAALEMLDVLCSTGTHPIMIDANEAWKDVEELIRFLPKLKEYPVEFVEQPMPAGFNEEYKHLKKYSPFPLMADESVLDKPDFNLLEQQFDGVNMKLMKAGGYRNGIRIINEAKLRGMKTMIGCMVETTLGISSAWNLGGLVNYADLDGCLIIENEPFHLLKENEGNFFENAG